MKDYYYLILLLILIVVGWQWLEKRKQKENKFRGQLIKTTDFILKASRYSTQDADKAGEMVQDLADLAYDKRTRKEAGEQLYVWKAKFGELYK